MENTIHFNTLLLSVNTFITLIFFGIYFLKKIYKYDESNFREGCYFLSLISIPIVFLSWIMFILLLISDSLISIFDIFIIINLVSIRLLLR